MLELPIIIHLVRVSKLVIQLALESPVYFQVVSHIILLHFVRARTNSQAVM